jgi:hypothetical protein
LDAGILHGGSAANDGRICRIQFRKAEVYLLEVGSCLLHLGFGLPNRLTGILIFSFHNLDLDLIGFCLVQSGSCLGDARLRGFQLKPQIVLQGAKFFFGVFEAGGRGFVLRSGLVHRGFRDIPLFVKLLLALIIGFCGVQVCFAPVVVPLHLSAHLGNRNLFQLIQGFYRAVVICLGLLYGRLGELGLGFHSLLSGLKTNSGRGKVGFRLFQGGSAGDALHFQSEFVLPFPCLGRFQVCLGLGIKGFCIPGVNNGDEVAFADKVSLLDGEANDLPSRLALHVHDREGLQNAGGGEGTHSITDAGFLRSVDDIGRVAILGSEKIAHGDEKERKDNAKDDEGSFHEISPGIGSPMVSLNCTSAI